MNPYEVLGVSRDSSKEEIKKAYRKLALQHHPDRQGGDETRFKEITQAHTILTDDEKRKRYDMSGSIDDQPQPSGNPFGGFGGFNFSPFGRSGNPFDMFEQMFRGNRGPVPPQKLPDKLIDLDIPLEDLWNGQPLPLSIHIESKCSCHRACDRCGGKGIINVVHDLGMMRQVVQQNCDKCHTSGTISEGCSKCEGGSIKQHHSVIFEIPARCPQDFSKVYPGWGHQSKNPSEISGDLVVHVRSKPHSIFVREQHHLVYQTSLSLKDSLVGPTIVIPLFSEPQLINLSQYGPVDPRHEYRVNGKGMKNTQGEMGDLILRFDIKYTPLSSEIRDWIALKM